MDAITRRTLLRQAALGSAAVAALGVGAGAAGAAEKSSSAAAGSGTSDGSAAQGSGKHVWEVKPDPIAASDISQTVDTEVLVI
ncbi:MAG: hypothetical protein SOI26_09885, partial [Coriobacteriales bacterium]